MAADRPFIVCEYVSAVGAALSLWIGQPGKVSLYCWHRLMPLNVEVDNKTLSLLVCPSDGKCTHMAQHWIHCCNQMCSSFQMSADNKMVSWSLWVREPGICVWCNMKPSATSHTTSTHWSPIHLASGLQVLQSYLDVFVIIIYKFYYSSVSRRL